MDSLSEEDLKSSMLKLLEEEDGLTRKLLRKKFYGFTSLSSSDIEAKKTIFQKCIKELKNAGKIRSEFDESKEKRIWHVKSKKRKFDSEHDVDNAADSEEILTKNATNDEDNIIITDESNEKQKIKEYTEVIKTGNTSILLFYAYCNPVMTKIDQDYSIKHCYNILSKLKMTGRLRIGREGYNATLTGTYDTVRSFTADLRKLDISTFRDTDFKYVDHLPDNQLLKGLKVFPVTEIVTYGFNAKDAPLDMRGTHLPPVEFHQALANPNSVVIDVRNFNETIIGKFAPPGGEGKVLDPCMRRSTEFPDWIDENRKKLEGKQVLMYCTAGVRCERASAFMRKKGIENVFQLEGGIHRYLDAFPDDGGYWIGKNYTFDKRFSHGAKQSTTISNCVHCGEPWDRYQAQKKCGKCSMEVLFCRTCQRSETQPPPKSLRCPLCK